MRRLLILLPMMLVFASLSARADDQLDITWRQARVIPLSKAATTVVVGDPTVADVTLDDPNTLVVFGKAPGETNIIVLSASHEIVLSQPLVVSPSNSSHISVLDASAAAPTEVLYACGQARCTRVLSPSDISFSASSSTSSTSSSTASKSASSSQEPAIAGGAAAAQDNGTAAPVDTNPPSN